MKLCFFKNVNPEHGNCNLVCHHKLHSTQDIVAPCIIMAEYCYTHPLIPSDLPLNNAGANLYKLKECVTENDANFTGSYKIATVQAVLNYHETHSAMLAKE